MTPASTDAMNTAPATVRGEASGVIQTLRQPRRCGAWIQVGGTIALAIMGTAVAGVEYGRLTDYGNQVGATDAERANFTAVLSTARGDPTVLDRLPAGSLEALRDSLIAGISTAYYLAGGVVLVGAVLAAVLLRRVSAADASPAPSIPVIAHGGRPPTARSAATDEACTARPADPTA